MREVTRSSAAPPGARARRRWGLAGLVIVGGIVAAVMVGPSRGPPRGTAEAGGPAVPSADLTKLLAACVHPVRSSEPRDDDARRVRVEFGSCVAVARPGTFLTAAHVARPGGQPARVVVLVNGRELAATVARAVAGLDAVVLSVPDYDGPVLPRAANPPKPGDAVFVAGFPVKYAGTAVPRLLTTRGRVEDPRHPSPLPELQKDDVIRVRGATDLGGSGGAVVNPAGELLGVVVASRFVRNEATDVYAVPVTDLTHVLDDPP